jgi:hypothetical protein
MQWLLWAAVTFASFLTLEVIAIRTKKKGDTLSEQIRAFFRVRQYRGRVAFVSVLFGFVIWFAGHILLRWV